MRRKAMRVGLLVAASTTAIISRTAVADAPEAPPAVAADAKPVAKPRVNRALADADKTIRAGLLKLAEKYPQLRQTNAGPLTDLLKDPSDAGTLQIYAAHFHGPKGGTQSEVSHEDAFTVIVVLRPEPDPNAPAQQMVFTESYPHLKLAGQVHTSAGDAKLDAALKKLINDAMDPVKSLEAEATPKQAKGG